jgi:hypothetical protein
MLPGQEVISLREYYDTRIVDIIARFETILAERDRLYDMRFKASEIAVSAALAAQEKSVNAAYAAQEKAVLKAEDAQKEYNQRSNEFRGQLDDQAKLLMARSEALGMFKSVDEKLTLMQKNNDDRISELRISNEKVFDNQTKEIAGLRESRSEGAGRGSGADKTVQYLFAGIGALLTLLLIGGIIVSVAYAVQG